jgi:hypothetical protein
MRLGGHLSTSNWRDAEAVELMRRDYGHQKDRLSAVQWDAAFAMRSVLSSHGACAMSPQRVARIMPSVVLIKLGACCARLCAAACCVTSQAVLS